MGQYDCEVCDKEDCEPTYFKPLNKMLCDNCIEEDTKQWREGFGYKVDEYDGEG